MPKIKGYNEIRAYLSLENGDASESEGKYVIYMC